MDTDQFESRRDRSGLDTRKKGGSKMLLPIIVIVVLVLIGVGLFIFMGKKKGTNTDTANSGTPTEAPTEAPSPTEETVDLKAFKVQVLNGTEVAGEAGKLKTSLEAAGFTVGGTGNADKTTYTKAIVQAKSSVPAGFVTKLKSEVEKSYEVGSDETLQDSDTNDVVVIIGIAADKQKTSSSSASTSDTATPSPSPVASKAPTSTPAP